MIKFSSGYLWIGVDFSKLLIIGSLLFYFIFITIIVIELFFYVYLLRIKLFKMYIYIYIYIIFISKILFTNVRYKWSIL